MRTVWNKLTHDEALLNMGKRANVDNYSFENFNYINSATKSLITCKIHGDYSICYNNFMGNRNCPECKKDKLSNLRKMEYGYNTDNIIQTFQKIYGFKYDYSLVEYKTMASKIKIICKDHGIFEKSSGKHRAGQGCPDCNTNKVFNYKLPAILYYIKHSDGFFKIGVSNYTNVKRRFNKKI